MIVNEGGRALCKCNICGHEWRPRKQRGGDRYREPWKCPALDCQSFAWNMPEAKDLVVKELNTNLEIDNKKLKENIMVGSDDYVKKSDIQHDKLMECINNMRADGKCTNDDIKALKEELKSMKTASCVGEDCIKKELKSLKDELKSLKTHDCPNCHKNSLHDYDKFCPLCGATGFTWIDENDNDK